MNEILDGMIDNVIKQLEKDIEGYETRLKYVKEEYNNSREGLENIPIWIETKRELIEKMNTLRE